jgi:hypothetical protein
MTAPDPQSAVNPQAAATQDATAPGFAGAAQPNPYAIYGNADMTARPMPDPVPKFSPYMALLLGGLALLGWFGFQTFQLVNERQALQTGHAGQQKTVESSGKLRTSLDALATDTQRLADSGNANARTLVEELRKRGITISTTGASGGAAGAAASGTTPTPAPAK